MLKCGAAERVVTPPLGLNIPSCMVPRYSTGIKNDLYTHALVADDGERLTVWITIDNAGLGPVFSDAVREALHEAIGVDPEAVMVSATHIHTGGPQLMEAFWGQKMDLAVNELFLKQTVAAAVAAYEKRVPVTVHYGSTQEKRISFCRNYRLKDGTVRSNPGRRRASEIDGPASEIDTTVGVLRFDDENGKPIAEVVNFGCHPDTVGGTEYCSDFPGAMRRYLKEVHGEDLTVLFFNGFSGNINHVDALRPLTDPEFVRYPKDHYEYMGWLLANDVLDVEKNNMKDCCGNGTVGVAVKRFRAPRRQPTQEDVDKANYALANPEAVSGVELAFARETLRLLQQPKKTEIVEIQALRIGDAVIVGFPGEPFSDMGLALRARSPYANLMLSELANQEFGYFATEPAFSANIYEARFPIACFELSVLDRMLDEAEGLLNKLHND